MYRVKLTYFKPSGKFYSEGEYDSNKKEIFEIAEEVRGLMGKELPGLVNGGGKDFSVLVSVPTHPHDHPILLHPRTVPIG
jgi:hypothetical protein